MEAGTSIRMATGIGVLETPPAGLERPAISRLQEIGIEYLSETKLLSCLNSNLALF